MPVLFLGDFEMKAAKSLLLTHHHAVESATLAFTIAAINTIATTTTRHGVEHKEIPRLSAHQRLPRKCYQTHRRFEMLTGCSWQAAAPARTALEEPLVHVEAQIPSPRVRRGSKLTPPPPKKKGPERFLAYEDYMSSSVVVGRLSMAYS